MPNVLDRKRAIAAALVGAPSLTFVLHALPSTFAVPNAALIFLLFVVFVSALGGLIAASIATIASLLLVDWYFVPPFRRLAIHSEQDVVTLVTFVLVAAIVSFIVERSERRALAIEQARADANAAQALARTNELRGAILSAVSHDLRTPLASIKTASTALLASSSNNDGPTSQLLTGIDNDVDRLDKMIMNLLDSSRVRSGKIDARLQPISVEEALTSLFDSVPEASERIVLRVPEMLPTFSADPVLLDRVLENIVRNALFFSDGAVTIEAGVEDSITIAIEDAGPGIPVNERERVLQPFQRVSDVSDGRGVGLGLSVAHGFVIAMGGQLALNDAANGGLRVTISLPIAEQS